MIQNPYRKGIAAGILYADAFIAWRDLAKETKDYTSPRPARPICPYSKPPTIRQWDAGFRAGLRRQGVS